MTVSIAESCLRFGVFQFDAGPVRLLKNGFIVRLGQQPLQVLAALLERPGEIVSREELRQRLWPSDVFVDFDHGLNKSVQKLRDALADSASTPLYIETIPRIGYRFIAPVEVIRETSEKSHAPALAPAAEPVAFRAAQQKWRIAGVCACLLILALATAWLIRSRRPTDSAIHSLAVLPLENLSGDPTQDYFADGTTDELITELARVPNLRIVSRNSILQDKGVHKPLQQIAAELHVDAIAEGSVMRSGDRIRINAQLVDARTDRNLWAQSFEGNAADALALEDNVARQIASHARLVIGVPASGSETEPKAIPTAAHDAYLRGRYFYDRRDAVQSAQYFQQAVDLDADYASAYAGLAAALGSEALLGNAPADVMMPRAMMVARKAIELDPNNAEAYTALAGVQIQYTWEWPAAERNLLRALELNSSNSLTEMIYSIYLDSMGRPDDAVERMRRAVAIDPLSFYMTRQLGTTLYFDRRYDEALSQLEHAREMQPGALGVIDNWESHIYEKKGMYSEAVQHDLMTVARESPLIDAEALRAKYQNEGWTAYWRARLAALGPHATRGCGYYEAAAIYLRLGQLDHTFEALRGAVSQRCFWVGNASVDPALDAAKNDPRFAEILRQINLPAPPRP